MDARKDHHQRSAPWIRQQVELITTLRGRFVRRWIGCDMAFLEVGADGLPQWEHGSAPELQLVQIELDLIGDETARISNYQSYDQFGLYRDDGLPPLSPGLPEDPASIFRDRVLPELPSGEILDVHIVIDGEGDIAEVLLSVAGKVVRMRAGEYWEEEGGALSLHEMDNCILVQVDGRKPG
ncbi:hypothetical protein P12x_005559 [Tundrisphaera lichenicola]|uniref:hypothetical protein n=1 Tax=Tundrisphaera lichenicola TaxID=2029860 RepID=UPI003EBD5218